MLTFNRDTLKFEVPAYGKSHSLHAFHEMALVWNTVAEAGRRVMLESADRVKAFAPKYAPLPSNPFSMYAMRRVVVGPFADGTYYSPELGRDVTTAEAEKLTQLYTNNDPTPSSMFVRKSRAERKAEAQEWKLELKPLVKALYMPYQGA